MDVIARTTYAATNLANPVTYTGRRLDPETGMYYYRHRIYHAELGRFLTRDPIGYEGSEWNLYEYVASSPTGYFDPSGLDRTICFFGHAWIEVDIYDDCCKKIGTRQLHFSPVGYTVERDCIYPSWFCVTIKSSCDDDRELVETWKDRGRRELKCCPSRDLWHWNPINNCWWQTLRRSW